MNSIYYDTPPLQPNGVNFGQGANIYNTLEHADNPQQWINGGAGGAAAANIMSSWYGEPFQYQFGRTMRFGATFTF